MIARVYPLARFSKDASKSPKDSGHSLTRTAPPAASVSSAGSATESGTARVWNGDIEEAMTRLFPLSFPHCSRSVPSSRCRQQLSRTPVPGVPVPCGDRLSYANLALEHIIARLGTREHGEQDLGSMLCDRNKMGTERERSHAFGAEGPHGTQFVERAIVASFASHTSR